MGWWPLRSAPASWQQTIGMYGAWQFTTVTASATAHTKGAWVEAVASTTEQTVALLVALATTTNLSNTDTSTLLDVGIGAAGSEVVVVADLQVGWKSAQQSWMLPLAVPAGARIALRCQSVVSSRTVGVTVVPAFGSGVAGGSPAGPCVAYGASASTSAGVVLTPGTNGFGSWAEVSPATSERIDAVAVSLGGNARMSSISRPFLLEVGTGASGSEVPIFATGGWMSSAEAVDVAVPVSPCALAVPAGARLAARVAAEATSQTLDLIVHGFRF